MKNAKQLKALRVGLSVLLGILLTVGVFVLTTGANLQSPAEAASLPTPLSRIATTPVTYTLDDFDDRVYLDDHGYDLPRPPNDFGGSQGRWESNGAVITDSTVCSETYNCYLSLTYDLSSPEAEGGYWEEFNYSYTSTWPLRDLKDFETFRFRVRGDPIYGFPDQFQVEFVGEDWGHRVVYSVTDVTADWQWKTIIVSNTTSFDWSRVKHAAIKLVGNQMTYQTGRLFFDDLTWVDEDFAGDLLDLIQRQAFLYFWDNRHPTTGFVRDRMVDPFYDRNVTSVAAVGFELAAFGIGTEHGWIDRNEAAVATHQILTNLLTLPQGPAITGTSGYNGFFYHLLIIDTGLRFPDSEVSTIDSALLMAGVLFAKQYYTGTSQTEIEIRDIADQLYNRVEWDWALRTESEPADKANQFYMAWKPEYHNCQASGYKNCYEIPDTKSGAGYYSGRSITGTGSLIDPTTWDYYTDEILLINLLAIGSPTHNVPVDTFWAWAREVGGYDSHTLVQSWYGQLFANFIGQAWLDMRGAEKNTHINWWYNSQQAALTNRQFAIDHAVTCTTYSTVSWGLSTSLGPPDDPTTPGMNGVGVYRGYSSLPRGDFNPPLHDCTVAPYAAAGSIMFLDSDPANNEAYQALDYWFHHQPRLWGLYGFRDGFNLNQGWFAHDYIGIDQGMTLLAIENYRTELIWDTLLQDPAIARARNAVLEKWRVYLPLLTRNSG